MKVKEEKRNKRVKKIEEDEGPKGRKEEHLVLKEEDVAAEEGGGKEPAEDKVEEGAPDDRDVPPAPEDGLDWILRFETTT